MRSVEERFWEKVDRQDDSDCWPWLGGTRRGGYGEFWVEGRIVTAHRFAYELLIGPIPAGLALDHRCEQPSCVNPFHCEPATNVENVLRGASGPAVNARKTHCHRGHPFDEENTYFRPNGRRSCRRCSREDRRRERLGA